MDSSIEILAEVVEADSAPPTYWRRADGWLERLSELLNPILVKETRQALKSRQFTITFSLLLLACFLWSIGGVAIVGPKIYYVASGQTLFYGYYLILCLPLAIIVPFSAFRSLAIEQEENTYDVLSISTLSPRQIVTGKLGSAVVQMVVYFSAVAPFLAFTYLLRGIDIFSIGLLMFYAFFGSLGLSAIGLLLATLTRQKMLQTILSVLLLGTLFLSFLAWWGFTNQILRWGSPVNEEGFWIAHLALTNAYVTSFLLVVFAAAAMLNFPGENGSTPLRIIMVIQQACYTGWIALMIVWDNMEATSLTFYREELCVSMFVAGVYWWIMGIFLTSEGPELSLRVKRRLPQSLLGRLFLTWFFPGPGTGYLFVVANLSALAVMALALLSFYPPAPGGYLLSGTIDTWIPIGSIVGYVAIYLGLGSLVIYFLRRRFQVNMLVGVILQVALPLIGMAVPLVIHLMTPSLRGTDYTPLQIPNPFWTLVHIIDHRNPPYQWVIGVVVIVSGVFVLLLNVCLHVVREVRQVRVVAPPRVLEEEAALHPQPPPERLSPWD